VDRRAGLIVLAVAACGPSSPRHPKGSAIQVVARGTLAYGVELAGDRLVTVELTERFELIVRSRDGDRESARLDLGPAEHDWPALAAAGDRAWVGGDTGVVIAYDLAAGAELARWPIGAPVTALAVAGDHVAIGDAAGVVCLRRAADGALVQCVVADDGPVETVAAAGDRLVSSGAGPARGWSVPSLASRPATPVPLVWRGQVVTASGRRVLAGGDPIVWMHGAVRDLAVGDDGTLAVAAWVGSLDHASVILVR
jgi:hypothetical protein